MSMIAGKLLNMSLYMSLYTEDAVERVGRLEQISIDQHIECAPPHSET